MSSLTEEGKKALAFMEHLFYARHYVTLHKPSPLMRKQQWLSLEKEKEEQL